jgi:hypothetical protein
MQSRLIFCSVIFPGLYSEINSLLLAESIRAFGGGLASSLIWFLMPDYDQPLAEKTLARLQRLDVRLLPFQIDQQKLQFFFMGQLAGLAQAEDLSAGETDLLAWLDANTILVQEPKEFLLPAGKSLGYRPVHHLLLGSRFDQPLDAFWAQIYRACGVPPERVFPMRPVVEDIQMRPYFNAGILITRPERGLFRQWVNTFQEFYQAPVFQAFYQQDRRYIIFMHQAILAGVVLHVLEPQALQELPESYNYPLHLFDVDKTTRRPASMEALITFRHEGFYQEADWARRMPASDLLKRWLAEKLEGMSPV